MIDRVGGIAPKQQPRLGAAARGSAVFSLPDPEGSAAPSVHSVAGAMLTGMLSLQADACDDALDREAQRRGQDLLGMLSDMQRDLLSGADDGVSCADRVRRLDGLARAVPQAADRGLRDVVAAIAVRARIEIARREVVSETLAAAR